MKRKLTRSEQRTFEADMAYLGTEWPANVWNAGIARERVKLVSYLIEQGLDKGKVMALAGEGNQRLCELRNAVNTVAQYK